MFLPSAELTAAELDLREQVRALLAELLPAGTFEPGLGMGAAVDPAFSAALAARGWVGMAVPERYGGLGATAVDRFVVVEELLRWAPRSGITGWRTGRSPRCCCGTALSSRSSGCCRESAAASCVSASA